MGPTPKKAPWLLWALLGAVAVVVILVLNFPFSSLDQRASKACTDRLVDVAGPTFVDYRVTEVISNPAQSYDIRGSYAGGEFACAVIGQTLEVPQALIYPTGGVPQSWLD